MKDKRGSFDTYRLEKDDIATYLGGCSVCLARANERSGDAAAIGGYLGSGTVFDKAIGDFTVAYADQIEQDYQLLVDAVNCSQVVA